MMTNKKMEQFLYYLSILLGILLIAMIIFQTIDRYETNKEIRESYEQLKRTNEKMEEQISEEMILLEEEREITNHLKKEYGLDD